MKYLALHIQDENRTKAFLRMLVDSASVLIIFITLTDQMKPTKY